MKSKIQIKYSQKNLASELRYDVKHKMDTMFARLTRRGRTQNVLLMIVHIDSVLKRSHLEYSGLKSELLKFHLFLQKIANYFKVFFFFDVGHFLCLCLICYRIDSVLHFGCLAMRHVGS